METAIKKAIEGGYEGLTLKDVETKNYQWDLPGNVLLDPLFWQCLGKALGWSEHTYFLECPCCGDYASDEPRLLTWQYHWHRFIDHLAEGKDINDFFNQLLK